jgi:peptide/nickel transport system permease protein
MSATKILVRRLLTLPPLLLALTLIVFLVSHLVPGDPVAAHLGQQAMENPETVAAFKRKWGLDDPLHVQYLTYVRNLLRGDMGVSLRTNNPVTEDLARFFPATVELGLTAIMISVIVSLPMGVISAVKRNHPLDHAVRILSLVGLAAPAFWLALIGLYVFYLGLGWLPGFGRLATGMSEPGRITGLFTIDSLLHGEWQVFVSAVRHLILPALVLSASSVGLMTRMIRSSLLDVLSKDYIRTARSKGLLERVVLLRHALRNALIPTVTILGVSLGYTLVGAVLTETIFSWPGLGRYGYQAVVSQDFPATMGVTLVVAIVFSLSNLAVDIICIFLDPRLRTKAA